eukprot:1158516-Pelagomonas_calceolata.AAC.1
MILSLNRRVAKSGGGPASLHSFLLSVDNFRASHTIPLLERCCCRTGPCTHWLVDGTLLPLKTDTGRGLASTLPHVA